MLCGKKVSQPSIEKLIVTVVSPMTSKMPSQTHLHIHFVKNKDWK